MIPRLVALGWLLLVWFALAGSFTPAGIVTGLLLCTLLLFLIQPRRAPRSVGAFRPVRVVQLAVYFLYRLILANVQVAMTILRRDPNRINRGIVAIPVMASSETIMALLANAITLTPGTCVLDSRRDPATLYVHVLGLTTVDSVQLETLKMERQLVRALGPVEELAQIDTRMAELEATVSGTREGAR